MCYNVAYMIGREGAVGYASGDATHLPDALIESIISGVGQTVQGAKGLTSIGSEIVERSRGALFDKSMIQILGDGESTTSIIAVDGGRSIERLPDLDLILIQAAGVGGLGVRSSDTDWASGGNQFVSWQSAMPHGESNEPLARGLMTLMEMLVLVDSDCDISIMDGSHLTSIIGVSQLLSVSREGMNNRYVSALRDFLGKYQKSINDIPDIVSRVLRNDNIVASTKYNSSKDIVHHVLKGLNLQVDDKSLCSKILQGGEYIEPQRIGQYSQGDELFDWFRTSYNLPTGDVNKADFDWLMNEAIGPIKTRDIHGNVKGSEIYFSYFKPYSGGPVYRLELKESLVMDRPRLEKTLRGIKDQVVFPDIIEPYPQYLADIIAKSVSSGMKAMKESVILSLDVDKDLNSIYTLRNYRT